MSDDFEMPMMCCTSCHREHPHGCIQFAKTALAQAAAQITSHQQTMMEQTQDIIDLAAERDRAVEERNRLTAALVDCVSALRICRIGDPHTADIGRVIDAACAALNATKKGE